MDTKQIDDYLILPYTIEVIREEVEGYSGWFARVVELPGCMTQADTFDELGEMIEDAMRAWIETELEEGHTIPEPRSEEDYSGKFVVRLPKSLHRDLVESAERESVSLNAFINVVLAKSVGQGISVDKNKAARSLPIINWPGLSEKVRNVLLVHGFDAEAQEVDEQLFAAWIDDYINQIIAAMQNGYYKEALEYVGSIKHTFTSICDTSPIVKTYCRVLEILENQVHENFQIRQGLVEHNVIQQQVQAQARRSTLTYFYSFGESHRETIRKENKELLEHTNIDPQLINDLFKSQS